MVEARCGNIEFSTELIQRFKKTFLSKYSAPYGIQPRGQAWYQERRENYYLTDKTVKDHLDGIYYIGACCRVSTKHVTIDIDNHNDEPQEDVWARAEAVMSVVTDTTPFVFSTPTHGIHLVYLLHEPVPQAQAVGHFRQLLSHGDIKLKQGYVEVLPAGRTIVRAPLGEECLLLDPSNLDPVAPEQRVCVQILNEILRDEKFDRYILPADSQARSVQKKSPLRTYPNGNDRNAYRQEIDDLIQNGLPHPSSRNDALLKLSWYYREVMGFDIPTTEQTLCQWIEQKNNGKSKDFEKDPESVRRHIEALVDHTQTSKPNLLNFEQSPLQKSRLEEAQSRVAKLTASDGERKLLSDMICYAMVRGITENGKWPCVEIPCQTLKAWHRDYNILVPRLVRRGYIRPGKNHCTLVARCKQYKIAPHVFF